ncbi:hypothetical protein CBR_g48841 [Chara braunii]|uniref:Uncharacterized protein n=1 Tax=Chara braunii TaxID=69332 RepID=A0A388M3R5_CHABU|nr:hypothetical protein CBR_g48841 [Chara braunii]|eukprot:GBG89132.1 hypothetical protein CBR_g48841 [Chara braunii]
MAHAETNTGERSSNFNKDCACRGSKRAPRSTSDSASRRLAIVFRTATKIAHAEGYRTCPEIYIRLCISQITDRISNFNKDCACGGIERAPRPMSDPASRSLPIAFRTTTKIAHAKVATVPRDLRQSLHLADSSLFCKQASELHGGEEWLGWRGKSDRSSG